MKDTAISYDLVHHPHHHQQPQHQHQQQHSWNHQRQQQQQLQTNTTSIYSNHQHLHQNSQPNSHSRQPQQQNQQHDAHVGEYSHQQLQSAAAVAAAAHQNATDSAAAYYQQTAHLYPTYHGQDQQQQQQTLSDHHAHHHPGASVSTPNNAATSALNAAVVAAAQQHAVAGTPTGGTINHHTGWSPAGVGALTAAATAGHHAVVTDHSNLAYITHAYQSHGNSAVNDHHRNSSGPLANQPIGSAAQAPTYTVDTLYSTPAAAAAAVAAYGYNNYNAAFFQTSNNGPHAQTGHPAQAGLSTFWNQNTQQQQQQQQQQRTTHSQTLANQAAATLSMRQQQLASDQSNNYLHDPRLYAYGRPAFTQNTGQNFGLHQQQNDMPQQQPPPPPHQHHRMSANLSQQHSLIQQHQSDIAQSTMAHQLGQQTYSIQATSLPNHQQTTLTNVAPQCQQHIESDSRKMQSTLRVSPQHPQLQKQQNDIEIAKSSKLEFDHISNNSIMLQKGTSTSQQHNIAGDEVDSRASANKNKDQLQSSTHQTPSTNSVSPTSKTQSVMKAETQTGQYQPRKGSLINVPAQSGTQQASQRTQNVYRVPHEDRVKSQTIDAPSEKFTSEPREAHADLTTNKGNQSLNVNNINNNKQQDRTSDDPQATLEDNMSTLSLGARKTTWASIASQPAKVSQPKSLKSKIAGSNSVLSSTNKHLTTSVTIDSSSLDSKNGMSSVIKSSVSTVTSTASRGSAAPPASKIGPAAAVAGRFKLDLLGEDGTDSKISWPAVNASINLTLEDTLPPKSSVNNNNDNQQSNSSNNSDRLKRDDNFKSRNEMNRDSRDHNHNQGPNSKAVKSFPHREERRQDDWHRREPREQRSRRDSDRRGDDFDKRLPSMDHHEDLRDHLNSIRDFGLPNRGGGGGPGSFRQQDEPPLREFKRGYGPTAYRKEQRVNENSRFTAIGRGLDHSREPSHHGINNNNNNNNGNDNDARQQNENAPHHHYNNVRDGNYLRNQQPPGKLDLNVHPHLNPDNFNPKTFDCEPENARFFIIKSYSEDDIHRSIKYSVWCSTQHGNRRLDEAYRQQQARGGQLFLFFSVNGSGHFCGVAQMTSTVDFESSSGIWAQSKWQGEFNVKWIYIKDVPNSGLRHITLENNMDKPVTNSRDTQEVPVEKGKAVLKIIHQYPHQTSFFDDFLHYERRQEEEQAKKAKKSSIMDHHPPGPSPQRDHDRERLGGGGGGGGGGRFGRPYVNARPHNDFPNRDRPARNA